MFAIDCPRHQARVLLGPRAVEQLVNTEGGVELHWRCHCGATGVETLGTTRSAAPSAA
jgi:hypothetical protein